METSVASSRASQPSAFYASMNGQTSGSQKLPLQASVRHAVTDLLVSIKSLLMALDDWSQRKRTDEELSDIYVRFGNDFNDVVTVFSQVHVDMSDLTSVPETLRGVLEECLSEEASPQVLEQHLPKVREVITRLLKGLRDRRSVVTGG
ncbi:hypothetical protein CPB83DRAFT_860104 [Crepidotus variabilis]|uniref:Aip3p/Bud6 N-terminal domain-containing protein n=1 Tax=Crepidotus variabilis TaxID=179855 RepID=A0A9P6EA46_9AGAR|nr:hypothetical protein CPB83DRAFT_860104 [Crepidotus variabilis]